MNQFQMNRRELVKVITSGAAVISVGGISIIACQDNNYKPLFFHQDSFQFLSNLSETILPDSEESPGAKIAGVASFLDRYIPICKSKDFQSDIKNTLDKLSKISQNNFAKPFHRLSEDELADQLNRFEELGDKGFQELKSLILFAYFSSMEGMTKALRFAAVPGKYDGDILSDNNQKSWAI